MSKRKLLKRALAIQMRIGRAYQREGRRGHRTGKGGPRDVRTLDALVDADAMIDELRSALRASVRQT